MQVHWQVYDGTCTACWMLTGEALRAEWLTWSQVSEWKCMVLTSLLPSPIVLPA